MNANASSQPGRAFGLFLICVGLFAWFFTRDITHSLGDNHDPGPRTFPGGLGFLLAAGGVCLVIRSFYRGKKGNAPLPATPIAAPTEPPPSGQEAPGSLPSASLLTDRGNRDVLFLVLALALYLPAINWLGFSLSTFAFATVMMTRLGARWLLAVGMSILLVVAIYLLFVRLFRVQLPEPMFSLLVFVPNQNA
jgi:hypothetical protein